MSGVLSIAADYAVFQRWECEQEVFRQCIKPCWIEEPARRPTFTAIADALALLCGDKSRSFADAWAVRRGSVTDAEDDDAVDATTKALSEYQRKAAKLNRLEEHLTKSVLTTNAVGGKFDGAKKARGKHAKSAKEDPLAAR